MNIVVIFAGGAGQRMNTKTTPKQFLEVHEKPIIVHTIEKFQRHPDIDKIVVACIESGIEYVNTLIDRYKLTKVEHVVPGGETGQLSIYNGLKTAKEKYGDGHIVLIHDGVRPIINAKTISAAIESVKKNGSAVTISPATETIALKSEDGQVVDIVDRSKCLLAKAPQCFWLDEIFENHNKALAEGITDFIDSACLMRHYGHSIYTVEGSPENIKITTPIDFYIMRAIIDAYENTQIFGIEQGEK